MKGIHGLIIAVFLGIAGLSLNWYYLYSKTKDIKSISFIGIKQGVSVRRGERFRESHFVPVRIPSHHGESLKQFVFTFGEKDTVAGIPATRNYEGGDVVLRGDYRTPSREVSWYPETKVPRDEQQLMWVTIDDKNFVPALVDPGDSIWFVVPEAAARTPTSVLPGGETLELKPHDRIGPFRVGSLGNRLGSSEVMRAERVPQVNERQVGIVVRIERNNMGVEEFDAQTQQLLALRERTDYRGLTVIWAPAEES
jgi:hypothetical protein